MRVGILYVGCQGEEMGLRLMRCGTDLIIALNVERVKHPFYHMEALFVPLIARRWVCSVSHSACLDRRL